MKKKVKKPLKKEIVTTKTTTKKRNKTKPRVSKKVRKAQAKKTINNRFNNSGKLPIGQTLETNDLFLPYKKTRVPNSKTRPVIIIDKNEKEEYAVVPGSTRKTSNTTYYNKHGIKYFRHNLEVEDNEGKPIKQNSKFKQTERTTKIPTKEANILKDEVINHTRFSSENRKKYETFKNRHKKSKD